MTLCHPAQQTAQCHDEVYGISHRAILCLIPLSDSLLNGINKLSCPLGCLQFTEKQALRVRVVGSSGASYQLKNAHSVVQSSYTTLFYLYTASVTIHSRVCKTAETASVSKTRGAPRSSLTHT